MLFYPSTKHSEQPPQTNRENLGYLNRLRTQAAWAVILLHVLLGMIDGLTPESGNWWLAHSICLLCQWAVPVYVMISGALLLDPNKQETPQAFYRKRLARIGLPLVAWTSFYFVVRRVFDHEPVGPFYIFDHLLAADPPYHTFYLFLIAGLYGLTPVLRPYIQYAQPRERRQLVVLILGLTAGYGLCNALLWQNQRYLLTFYLLYLGYYLAGYELRHLDLQRIKPKFIILAVILSVVYIAILVPTYMRYDGRINGRFVIGYDSLPVMVLSLAVFAWTRNRQERRPPRPGWFDRICEKIAPQTFGIYLLHLTLLIGLREIAGDQGDDLHFIPVALVVTAVVFVMSWGLTWLLQKIPLLQRLV